MNAPIRVEPAAHADLPALVSLLGVLFAQEREFRPDPERQRIGLTRILDNPAIGTIFVALEQSAADREACADSRRVIGMCSLLFSESTFLGAAAAWLEDVIVHPDRRGAGAGTALLAAVKRYATGHGIRRISLLTDFDNEAAMRLYERAGFARSSMVPMRWYLSDER